MPNPAWHKAGIVLDLEPDNPPRSDSRWRSILAWSEEATLVAGGSDARKSDEPASQRAQGSAGEALAMHP